MAIMKTWNLIWAPEGRIIATVQATTARAAVRKAPKPYSRYKGEIYAVDLCACATCNKSEAEVIYCDRCEAECTETWKGTPEDTCCPACYAKTEAE